MRRVGASDHGDGYLGNGEDAQVLVAEDAYEMETNETKQTNGNCIYHTHTHTRGREWMDAAGEDCEERSARREQGPAHCTVLSVANLVQQFGSVRCFGCCLFARVAVQLIIDGRLHRFESVDCASVVWVTCSAALVLLHFSGLLCASTTNTRWIVLR